jgi:hypothetical protein
MALFHNFGVNRRNRLCGVHAYASTQFLDFLELAENCAFLDRKLISALKVVVDGHYLNGRVKKAEAFFKSFIETLFDNHKRQMPPDCTNGQPGCSDSSAFWITPA